MPYALWAGRAQSTIDSEHGSGRFSQCSVLSGYASSAARRAAPSSGKSAHSSKQQITRETSANTELNHNASSSGCATTNAEAAKVWVSVMLCS
jgi:hypothetical protein